MDKHILLAGGKHPAEVLDQLPALEVVHPLDYPCGAQLLTFEVGALFLKMDHASLLLPFRPTKDLLLSI